MSAYTIAKAANPDGSLTVVLGGTLSIETSGELHRILTESLDESAQIMLDFSAVENIDITSMQVICAACKTAAEMGRGYDCESGSIPDCIASFGSSIGGPQGLPCSQNNNKPCLWYGGIR